MIGGAVKCWGLYSYGQVRVLLMFNEYMLALEVVTLSPDKEL